MKRFFSVNDVKSPTLLVDEAIEQKKNPLKNITLGAGKTLGLVFLNASLRTRLSTQKAAHRLGLQTIVLNVSQESWAWEFEEGAIMNGSSVEHIKDAAKVLSQYCDFIALRCFANLEDKKKDVEEKIFNSFEKYATVPIVSLESATLHPLQSLADCITIKENTSSFKKPKIVLTWAPHVKAIPHAVANSFAQWITACHYDLTITHPKGYELDTPFTNGATIEYDQKKALQDADFIYVKNWSSFENYGQIIPVKEDWMLTKSIYKIAPKAQIMHCLPVRRNVEISDELLDSKQSLIYHQAENRTWAAQIVLQKILENYESK